MLTDQSHITHNLSHVSNENYSASFQFCNDSQGIREFCETNKPDIVVTFFNSPFGNFLQQNFSKILSQQYKQFKSNQTNEKNGAPKNLENPTPNNDYFDKKLIKAYCGADFNFELENSLLDHESLDQSATNSSRHYRVDMKSFLEFDFPSNVDTDPKSPDVNENLSQMNACFNCNETSHMISECPHPYNPQMVAKNKNEMRLQRSGSAKPKDEAILDFISKLTPGKVSQELERAMGIGTDQLPIFVYNMRRHGYPPGWLRESEKTSLQFVDAAQDESESESITYDPSKIVRYPGFNCEIERGKRDDSSRYGFLPINKSQFIPNMLRNLNSTPKPNKNRKIQKSKNSSKVSQKNVTENMIVSQVNNQNCGSASANEGMFINNQLILKSSPDLSKFAHGITPHEQLNEADVLQSTGGFKRLIGRIRDVKNDMNKISKKE